MKPMFPIKQRRKGVNIFSQRGVINILIKTELDSPPLGHILISLDRYDIKHLIPKCGYSEISICTKY